MPILATTLFASAFLLFVCQPMVGKMVLPYLGGAAAVWTTCVLFFQAMLLAGYVYAHLLGRASDVRKQIVTHAFVLLLPFSFLPMAFKGDSDDWRDSLAYKLRTLLEVEAEQVFCTDPFIKDPNFTTLDNAVQQANIIVLGAPHSVYRSLTFGPEKFVVDFWNFWPTRKRRAKNSQAA